MALGQALQRLHGRRNLQVVGIGRRLLWQLADHEVADTAAVEFGNVAMPVVLLRTNGEEQRFLGEDKRAAVGEQPVNMGVGSAHAVGADECSDGFYRIGHDSFIFHFVTVPSCTWP